MERKLFLGAIVVLSAMAAAFFGARQATQSRPDSVASRLAIVQRQITDLQQELEQAESEGDATRAATFYSEDARFFPIAERPQLGRDQIEQFYARTPYAAERRLERLELQGDLVIAVGEIRRFQADGADGEPSDSGFLSIWRFDGQKWELMLDLHEPSQPTTPR